MKMKQKFIVKGELTFIAIALGAGLLGNACLAASEGSRANLPHNTDAISTHSIMFKIEKAVQIEAMKNNGKVPESLDCLVLSADEKSPPLLKEENLLDEWGGTIEYERDGRKFILRSSGPDKKMGTPDDLVTGWPGSFVESWKAKNLPPVEAQGTNTVQAATGETAQPTDGVGKVTPKSVPVISTQPSAETDDPANAKTAPWKIPLLIVVAAVGAMAVWRCFRKKKT